MFEERMLAYYPTIIQYIQDIRAIIKSESVEIEGVSNSQATVLENAYLQDMHEDRIIQWEKLLSIKPVQGSTLEDRRDTIIARIRGQGKLNTQLINSIVSTFTGGTANSYIQDSTLYVEISPPPGQKQYIFTNVEQELKYKIPAHLGLSVTRHYSTWRDMKYDFTNWNDVKNSFTNWDDIKFFVESE